MDWSVEQDAALKAVKDWLKGRHPQVFRLFGFAGTGKTTLARHVAEGIDGDVCFGAFTGKAAMVMRQKGCEGATTIHSMIYRPRRKSAEDEEEETFSFAINHQSDVSKAKLIVIDECSMVDEELGRDLLSFGKPTLVLGDPAQLPPIKGGGFFTEAEPDVMLTEVHRQAADNPIVRMSMDIREGRPLEIGHYGQSSVIRRRDIDAERILAADQVLVGLNRTRHGYNKRIRELRGYTSPHPEVGEKLVCLRNDKSKGLQNGGIFRVNRRKEPKGGYLKYDVAPDEAGTRARIHVSVLPDFFEGKEGDLSWQMRRSSDEFDYGYALTVHKAQGSQWDDVVLFDEAFAFREHRDRWLYTGVTRAAETLTVVV
ncbi:ATP-dependent DNA helicase [Prosthecomicrobium hirschii]|uniref:ATP-binding protein n=1 Tax=Prosthecodimorpha hirschii TaxID=665126 RepID=A0A0P6VWB0_9HYPH|nr:ATP-dependent RecD-like DNA helicase [Prosthecomicrobium hirschii]KPL51164.1 ATP-binding protein [Prosthecomicrobium hirschii]MCW1838980.1 ATP-dependent RecD-like DNA helicase [Prosthecomicrobium hirschii]TPQ49077.1 ATP-binding protein [Prosthecomicrobium hirschii]